MTFNRTSTTTYDPQGRFPISASNALGHTETRVFDPKFGSVTSVTGPNNLTSTFASDTWGRPTSESGPDGVATTITRALGNAAMAGWPVNSAYYVSVSKPGAPTVQTFFDPFNRELRSRSTGFDGRWIIRDTAYDNLGRVVATSRRYYEGAIITTTRTSYDLLNRVRTETDAQGNISTIDYYGLTDTTTNALSQTRTTVNNSQGQIVNVTNVLGNLLRYRYDPFGNLLSTTDPAGNITILNCQRQIEMSALPFAALTAASRIAHLERPCR